MITGKSAFKGVTVGKLHYYVKSEAEVTSEKITDPELEFARYEQAKKEASDQLSALYEDALNKVGEEEAMIFEIHGMLLEDEDWNEAVHSAVFDDKDNACYAVSRTAKAFSEMFAAMDDEYMRGRAADMKDIGERLIRNLLGEKNGNVLSEPCIVVAEDLLPSETVQLDKDKVLGFVTHLGSTSSHTAILARTMGIPALVDTDTELSADLNGKTAVLDGDKGILIVDPDDAVLSEYMEKQKKLEKEKEELASLIGRESITRSGRKVKVFSNIGGLSDVDLIIKNDAEGIGLFRTEFIYLESKGLPTEEEQFRIYKEVAERMAPKNIVFRTLDIGADKKVDYLDLPKEDNPALGLRAIRLCLTRPEIFRTQLRALLRASAFGNISIMFPMIISLKEVREIKGILADVKNELKSEGHAFDENIETGIMIETPAAVLESEELSKEVDFFSIGTNDLTQYTLAIDRQNQGLERFFDPHHPAVLKMIRMAAENAHKAGIWIGICGELGADLSLTETFLDMGIDELSVAPSMVLPLRKKVLECE